MAVNYGKAFESKFKEDFLKLPDSTIDRIYDQVSGFKCITGISDFIGYKLPSIFYLEIKSVHGASFPFTNFSQYEKLKQKVGIPGVRAGVVIWFVDHECVQYIPVSTFTQMKSDGKKSVNYKEADQEKYRIIKIPSTKRRVFLDSDYSVLTTLQDGE